MSPAIPRGARILVTGANGFLAPHIIDQLLLAGYNVRGTVRALPKGDWLSEHVSQKFGDGRLELAEVPDMARPGAFDDVIKGTAGIVHVASNLSFSPDPTQVVTQYVDSTNGALDAASKEPLVKRFVLTSSSAAATWPNLDQSVDVDENTWNTECIKRAWAPPPYEPERAWDVYAASKAESELALWKFVRERNPHFVANSVIPNTLFGPLLAPGKQQNTSTAGFINGIYDTGLAGLETIPPQYHCDVRDAARLHVAALTDSNVQNERIFAFGDKYNWNKILGILRRLSPDHEFPSDLPNLGWDQSRILKKSRAEDILRKNYVTPGFTSLEDTIRANVSHLL